MSDFIDGAVKALNEKMADANFDGTAKIDVTGEGSIMLSGNAAQAGDGEADVTLTADADTLHEIFDGSLNPTSAFMSGKLTVDGDMGMAMKLAAVLG